jgi:MurNAc alpha-1-phosphate uridylyltransferase
MMQIVIIAGGFATRLGELTKHQPKSMLNFGGKPFLEHQVEFLRRAGCTDIVLCLGYLAQSIVDYFGDGQKFGVKIRYSIEDKPLGTAGALKKAAPLLQNTFFTLYGDSYLFPDCAAINTYFETHAKLALMTVFDNHDKFDKSNTAIEGNFVTRYSKLEKTPDMHYIDYGINLFNKKMLGLIPDNQSFPLETVFSRLIEERQLLAYEVEARFYEVGSLSGVDEFRQYIESRK